jgi:hypothetical protein
MASATRPAASRTLATQSRISSDNVAPTLAGRSHVIQGARLPTRYEDEAPFATNDRDVRFCSLAGGSGADEVSTGRNGRGLRQFLPRNGAHGAIENLYQGCRALPSSLFVRGWKTIFW